MNDAFVNYLKEKYNINSSLKNINDLKGYPHIKILSFEKDYILKKFINYIVMILICYTIIYLKVIILNYH